MYIQITTRCNMSCLHCCYGCNDKDGEDMPVETFELIMEKWGEKICKTDGRNIILGGGEPTGGPDNSPNEAQQDFPEAVLQDSRGF